MPFLITTFFFLFIYITVNVLCPHQTQLEELTLIVCFTLCIKGDGKVDFQLKKKKHGFSSSQFSVSSFFHVPVPTRSPKFLFCLICLSEELFGY